MFFSDLNSKIVLFEDARFLPPPVREKNLTLSAIASTDSSNKEANTVNGYCIDFGGFETMISTVSANKTVRYVYQKVKTAPTKQQATEIFIDLLNNIDKAKNKEGVLLGLASILHINSAEFSEMNAYKCPLDIDVMSAINAIYSKAESVQTKKLLIEIFESGPQDLFKRTYPKFAHDLNNHKELFMNIVRNFSPELTITPDHDCSAKIFKILLDNVDQKNPEQLNELAIGLTKFISHPQQYKECIDLLKQSTTYKPVMMRIKYMKKYAKRFKCKIKFADNSMKNYMKKQAAKKTPLSLIKEKFKKMITRLIPSSSSSN